MRKANFRCGGNFEQRWAGVGFRAKRPRVLSHPVQGRRTAEERLAGRWMGTGVTGGEVSRAEPEPDHKKSR